MQKRLMLSLVFLFFIGILELQAQNAISSSGGNALGSGGNASYTIGQVFLKNNSGANGSVSEGVQQAIVIETIDGIEQATDINLFCKVYPNPATDILTLTIENFEIKDLSYELIDLGGKSIEINKIKDNKTTISIVDIIPGMYFLVVKSQLQKIKTFQIIKK